MTIQPTITFNVLDVSLDRICHTVNIYVQVITLLRQAGKENTFRAVLA